MKDVDAERMAASHSLRIRQSMGRKKAYLGFGSRQVSGSEPTDDRSVMLSRIATASAVAVPLFFLAVRSVGRVIARGCLRASVLRL